MAALMMRRAMMQENEQPVFVDWIQIGGTAGFIIDYTPSKFSYVELICKIADNVATSVSFFGGRAGLLNKEFYIFNNGTTTFCRIDNKEVKKSQNISIFKNKKLLARIAPVENLSNNYGLIRDFDTGVAIFEAHNISVSDSFRGISKLAIGSLTEGGRATYNPLKIYRFLIIEQHTSSVDSRIHIHIFLPSYYRGEYGLWDTASNTFYGNSGSGTITGGND